LIFLILDLIDYGFYINKNINATNITAHNKEDLIINDLDYDELINDDIRTNINGNILFNIGK
jgi:hypothetical protein